MSGPQASPFDRKSGKTKHSPPQPTQNQRETSLQRNVRTRNQTRLEEKPDQKEEIKTRSKSITENKTEAKEVVKQTPTQEEVVKPNAGTVKQKTQNTKMDQKQIQKLITENAIPEFNGENRVNELARFIGMADNLYTTLTTDAERHIFTNLLKFKLTGDAYTRISHREVDSYDTFKNILNNMYAKTFTLNELEHKFTNIQQQYGETVRNYGYRLMEALDQYKSGYKSKYQLQAIDASYGSHLNTTAVQSFKKGLNNTILKEKIVTIKASNVDDIISETEVIEHMLATLTTQPTTLVTQPTVLTAPPHTQLLQQNNTRQNVITCNYCQKPNHTWNVCRTRMAAERNLTYNSNPQPNRQQFQSYNPQQNRQPPQNYTNNNFRPAPPQNQNNFTPRPFITSNNRYQVPQSNNFNQYRQPQQRNNYEPKYCSHCKTTTGHTFDECRSKFLGPRTYNTGDFPRQQQSQSQPQPQSKENLEEAFKSMKIGQIMPQQLQQDHPQQMYANNQGNANGSDQQ